MRKVFRTWNSWMVVFLSLYLGALKLLFETFSFLLALLLSSLSFPLLFLIPAAPFLRHLRFQSSHPVNLSASHLMFLSFCLRCHSSLFTLHSALNRSKLCITSTALRIMLSQGMLGTSFHHHCPGAVKIWKTSDNGSRVL